MKITVACSGCGANFTVPTMLAGQTVKCPRCNTTNQVSTAAPPAAADANGQTPGPGGAGEVGSGSGLLEASGVLEALRKSEDSDRSGLGRRVRNRKSAATAGTEVDPDSEGKMERLYGVYTGKEWVDHSRGRVTWGISISIAMVLLGIAIGV